MYTHSGSSFKILTTSLWVSPIREMPLTWGRRKKKTQVFLRVPELFCPMTLCVTRSHLQQLVATEQLAAAADGPLGKDWADVVVAAVCFQADAQAAALTELLHLSHLPGRKARRSQWSGTSAILTQGSATTVGIVRYFTIRCTIRNFVWFTYITDPSTVWVIDQVISNEAFYYILLTPYKYIVKCNVVS